MAKRKGVIGTVGSIGRMLIWGLAAILVVAIWLAWSDDTAPPEETTAEALPEAVEPETDAATDEPDELEESADTTEAAAPSESADAAETEAPMADSADAAETDAAEPAAEGSTTDAGAVPSEDGPASEDVAKTTTVEEEAPVAAEATSEVSATEDSSAEAEAGATADTSAEASGAVPLPVTERQPFEVEGEDADYALVNVVDLGSGVFEATTERTEAGLTETVTRRITCDPREEGLVAEGDGARIDVPDMNPIEDGTAQAAVATLLCAADGTEG